MDDTDVRLLKPERNEVFRLVEHVGLSTSCFAWEESIDHKEPVRRSLVGYFTYTVSVLVHVPSQFAYTFGKFIDQFSPGINARVEKANLIFGPQNKDKVRRQTVYNWLRRLREEVETPDLWQEMLKDRELYQIASSDMYSLEVFTSQDKLYLSQQLKQVQNQLAKEHQLSANQAQAVEQRFAEIVEGMDRFGKKDWINWAIGALTGFALNAMFSPSAARDMLHGFIAVVGPLFDAAVKLIPPV